MRTIDVTVESGHVPFSELNRLAARLNALKTERTEYHARPSFVHKAPVAISGLALSIRSTSRVSQNRPTKRNAIARRYVGIGVPLVDHTIDVVAVYLNTPEAKGIGAWILGKIAEECWRWIKERRKVSSKPQEVILFGPDNRIIRTVKSS